MPDPSKQAEARFQPIPNSAALDAAIQRSHESPVLLFNYDPWCSINAFARDQLEGVAADISVVNVADDHDLGQQVAKVTGVRHESPQTILLSGGKAVWSASHYKITADAVRQALENARPGA